MKKYIWIFGGIFLVLLAIVISLFRFDAREENKTFLKIDKDKIISILVESPFRKYEILRVKDDFELGLPQRIPADKEIINEILEKATIQYDAIISENLDNIGEFGLETPATIVSINLADKTKKVINIGDLTPGQDGYYVRLDGESTIYKVLLENIQPFNQSPDDLINKNILYSLDRNKIDRIELIQNGVTKVLKKEGNEWATDGLKINEEAANLLLDKVFDARVDGIEMTEVELNQPIDLTLTFFSDTKEVSRVLISKKDEVNYYIKREGVQLNYNMSAYTFENLKSEVTKIFDENAK